MSGTVDRRDEEHVPQFHGRIDEKFAEWEIDVKLWEAEYKEDDRVRLGQKAVSKRTAWAAEDHWETKLGTQDAKASRKMVMENFLKSLDKRHWMTTSTCDKERRKASRIIHSVKKFSLKKDTAVDLDEKIRGYWLMRTSNLAVREISGIKIITQGQTELAQVKKAITQTIVAKKREEVRDDLREARDRARDRPGGYAEAPNFHLDGESDDDQEDWISESESNCSESWYDLDAQEPEALISLRDARKKLQHATKSRRFYPKRWWPCQEHRKIHR